MNSDVGDSHLPVNRFLGPVDDSVTTDSTVTKSQMEHRPGWAPDPLMVASGIRSPIGLMVGSCTSHPGVLGSIPKREEPGKTGAPCVKVPGSSRVPAPPWVGSRFPDGWDQIPYLPGGWVLHQPPWSFGSLGEGQGGRMATIHDADYVRWRRPRPPVMDSS
jgi:hypothetical protein